MKTETPFTNGCSQAERVIMRTRALTCCAVLETQPIYVPRARRGAKQSHVREGRGEHPSAPTAGKIKTWGKVTSISYLSGRRFADFISALDQGAFLRRAALATWRKIAKTALGSRSMIIR